jgi:hypothetical protein
MVKSSAGCLVCSVVAMLVVLQLAQPTLFTQTKHLQPVVFNPQSRKPMYLNPTEPIFIPEPLRLREVASSAYQILPLPEIHSVVDGFLRGMNKFLSLPSPQNVTRKPVNSATGKTPPRWTGALKLLIGSNFSWGLSIAHIWKN